MQYLVDTNVLLWHATDDRRLPDEFRDILETYSNELYVSIVSLWEITIKSSRGDLDLIGDIGVFIDQQVRRTGFKILPIRTEHLLTLRQMPFHHKDPFDRLIVAQSLVEELPLLYTDKVFEHYFAM